MKQDKLPFQLSLIEYNRTFSELSKLYKQKIKEFKSNSFLYGWTWWSLPLKMWREAKALGFKNDEYNQEWIFYNTISGYGDYNTSKKAQETALEIMQKKYPHNNLLKNLSTGGRLD